MNPGRRTGSRAWDQVSASEPRKRAPRKRSTRSGSAPRPASGRRTKSDAPRRDKKDARRSSGRGSRSRGYTTVSGTVSYTGMNRGGHIIVGLFDRKKPGTPLTYWVNLEEPGDFLLEGMEPGEYELHACMSPRINAEGMPVDVVATGSWERNRTIKIPSNHPLDSCNVDVFDETPSGVIHGIDTVFVEVADMDRSVRFYRDMLGLSIITRDQNWSEFDCGATLLALQRKREIPKGRRPTKNKHQGGSVVFRVENLDHARSDLIERGVENMGRIVDLPEVRWATFEDLDGNRLQIFERKPG